MDHLNTNIKWGIYLGLAVSAATQILTCMGLGLTNWFVFATYALVILCLILIFRILKKQNQGKLKFSTAIISTIIIVLVGRIIFQGYMWAYTNFVEPNWVNDVAEIWTNMLEESI
ncbi:MAG: DUF4199 domain-containing protein, partial [Bacteroidia bacterium]|nr:DUF4199 domain-containing protein [Bacteroidia bacterium]